MVRTLAVDDLLREPQLEIAPDQVDEFGPVTAIPHVLRRATDRAWVATGAGASLVQHPALLSCLLSGRGARAVPYIRVAGHHHHHLLAASPNPDRWMWLLDRFGVCDGVAEVVVAALEGGPILGPERDDGVERFAQPPHAVLQPFDAKHPMFGLRP